MFQMFKDHSFVSERFAMNKWLEDYSQDPNIYIISELQFSRSVQHRKVYFLMLRPRLGTNVKGSSEKLKTSYNGQGKK